MCELILTGLKFFGSIVDWDVECDVFVNVTEDQVKLFLHVIFRAINEWSARPLGEKRQARSLAVICSRVDLTKKCLDGKSERKRTNRPKRQNDLKKKNCTIHK